MEDGIKKLTSEELQDISLEVQETAEDEVASDEKEKRGENALSSDIKNIFDGIRYRGL